jgi:hypothetical protein
MLTTKKALTNLSDIRSKPWVFVSFGPSQKKEPLGGGEPRQDCAKGKNSDRFTIPACAGMTTVLETTA